jgi:hypothetical protein
MKTRNTIKLAFIISMLLTGIVNAAPPAIPTITSAVPNDSSVTITWPDAAGAMGYNLYWSTNPNVNIKNNFTMKVPGVTSPFTQTKLANGIPYYFVVQSVNNKGSSYGSNTATATPEKPCPAAKALLVQIDQLFVEYNKLTGNKDKAKRMQIKAQIIYLTGEMKAAQAACNK